jgi:hypothetical protein
MSAQTGVELVLSDIGSPRLELPLVSICRKRRSSTSGSLTCTSRQRPAPTMPVAGFLLDKLDGTTLDAIREWRRSRKYVASVLTC